MYWEVVAKRVYPRDCMLLLDQADHCTQGSGEGIPRCIAVEPNSFVRMVVEGGGEIESTSNRLYDLRFQILANGEVMREIRERHRSNPRETIISSWYIRWIGPFKQGGKIELAVRAPEPGDAVWTVNSLVLYGVN